MPSYRFCRPDDRDLLIKGVNQAYLVHFPDCPEFLESDYNRLLREAHLWSSNSLVVLGNEKDDVLSICIGCKREEESMILMIGSRPDQQRKGHALHLLTSLSGKLAVLGPPKLVTEVPADNEAALNLFQKADYKHTATFTDYVSEEKPEPPAEIELVETLTVADLERTNTMKLWEKRAWIRQRESLIGQGEELQGLGVISEERIESYILFKPLPNGGSELLALESATTTNKNRLAKLLIIACIQQTPGAVHIPKLSSGEISGEVLRKCGFRPANQHLKLEAEAEPC